MIVTDLIPISVSTLLPTEVVGLDLFRQEVESEHCQLYRAADYPLTMDDLSRLKHRGVTRLYINKSSRSVYQSYLRKVATASGPNAFPLTARVGALNEVVRDVLESAFKRDDVAETVNAAKKLGSLATELITQDEFTVSDLFQVLHHDYATFTHSANVAFYSGLLANELGYSKDDVEKITTGGLLHDLGKLEIGEHILCKPGKLSDDEFRIIRLHPTWGFKKLAHRDDLNEGQLMMAYQHHERLDGKGYPVGCVADDIHPWANICAVVDVFEALTSQRPYRTPMTRSKALALLQRDSGTHFDSEVLACWKSIIQRNLAS
ncbi:MAG: HD-GYP domain-containing protein [Rubripirellula sp.]